VRRGDDSPNAIAIVGMAGRFPGARDLEQFWQNLRQGVESVRFLGPVAPAAKAVGPAATPVEPAAGQAATALPPAPGEPHFVPAVAEPEGIEEFDAPFFGISHREAELMDPQHRLFLECCWEALESAGYVPESFGGQIGVFGGATTSTYLVCNLAGNPRLRASVDPLQLIVGNAIDSLTTRVSFKLDLHGPSHAVQCACSTALVAVHLGCESLLDLRCDMALAGAVSLNVGQRSGYPWQPDSILSPDGHCRAFDAAAEGTIFGGGVGVVALRRLADALADGDPVRAVILGSSVNNDGASKVGYSAPSVEGEARAIIEALAVAGVPAESIGYVEAHGTGTPLGDPVEVQALTRAFRSETRRRGFCALGTVKSNIGHLDIAAGIAGLIKTVLALEHREIPPTLHFERPNPRLDLAASPFRVATRLAEWPRGTAPRRAGVSAFGFGGTNAHLVLEEAPAVEAGAARQPLADAARAPTAGAAAPRPARLLLLSARSEGALERAARRLAEHLRRHPEVDLGDVAWTLHAGRRAFSYRRMLVCASAAEAADCLESLDPARSAAAYDAAAPRQLTVTLLLPGEGAEHAGVGRGLYDAEPVYRQQIDAAARLLEPHLGLDLRPLLFPEPAAARQAEERLRQPALAQPALFIGEYALAQLWTSWGVAPAALLGLGAGEYVAACLAGVLSLADALALVAARGRITGELPAGPKAPLAPAAAPLAEALRRARLAPPAIPLVSSVTGAWMRAEEATSPDYWMRQLLAPARAAEAVQVLLAEPERVLLEIGPGPSPLAVAASRAAARPVIVSLPDRAAEPGGDHARLLRAAGRLWLAGQRLDAVRLHDGPRRRRLPLPTYPFERHRYWIEPPAAEVAPEAVAGMPAPGRSRLDEPAAAAAGGAADERATGQAMAAGSAGSADSARSVASAGGGTSGSGLGLHPRPPLPTAFLEPRGEVEEQVAAIWREFLGVDAVGVYDSFFELGGDSLLATRMMWRLQHVFGLELQISAMFVDPTVAAMAASIVAAKASDADPLALEGLLAEIGELSEADLEAQLEGDAADSDESRRG
jgi:phthiocerol/phenolphthiocerol synthesis type-I polyketide synthase E